MNQTKSILTAVGIMAAGALSASASMTLGPLDSTTIALTLTDWSNPISFPEFNPTLGTLLSVTLTYGSTGTTALTVSNAAGAGTASHITASTIVEISVEDSGNNFLANDPQITLASTPYNFGSLAAGSVSNSGVLGLSGSYSNTYTSSAILSEFKGTGSFSLEGSTFTLTQTTSSGGNLTFSQVTDVDLTGTVTYTYTPAAVPEPSTMVAGALTILPFCGGALRKLRKKTRA